MYVLKCSLWCLALIPWFEAWRRNRETTVLHAVHWGMLAWLAWGYVIGKEAFGDATLIALCLTGCAGVAVLGARRPQVGAWNFVVLGLAAVMLLPLAEGWILGTRSLDGLRQFFLVSTLAIGIGNYLPTRLAWGGCSLGLGCGLLLWEKWAMSSSLDHSWHDGAHLAILLSPWLAWIPLLKKSREGRPLDDVWLSFRDRMGIVWAQRVREQFNASAKNQNWPVELTWRGVEGPEEMPEGVEPALNALLKRFRTQED